MSRCFSLIAKFQAVGLAAAFSFALLAGCAGVPSKEEMSMLEEKRQAVEKAENTVAERKAEKAQLEKKVAEKKAALEEAKAKNEATKAALAARSE